MDKFKKFKNSKDCLKSYVEAVATLLIMSVFIVFLIKNSGVSYSELSFTRIIIVETIVGAIFVFLISWGCIVFSNYLNAQYELSEETAEKTEEIILFKEFLEQQQNNAVVPELLNQYKFWKKEKYLHESHVGCAGCG